MDKINPFSADNIKNPKKNFSPQYPADMNGNYNASDLDFTQWETKFANIDVIALHTRDDCDSGPHSHHHTLGYSRNQASPGDHIHDGFTSKLVGNGMALSVTGAKGGNVALTNLLAMLKKVIVFTDTTT
jgi:hypothetical protein